MKCQPPSQTSAQVWLPRSFAHSGVPAARAGMPTARQASTRMIDSPVQVALPMAADSDGLWFGALRPVL